MGNEIQGGGNHELSTDINTITAEINAYQRVAGEAIFEIGRRLKHVKENDLAHGEWADWCKEEIGMSVGNADKFIVVFERLGVNHSTSSSLGMSALYEIATLPPEHRGQSHTIPSTGAGKKPEDMTVKELREVKRQLKTEQEEKKQAQASADQYRKSSEIERKKREEVEEKEPEIETRTVEIEKEPRDYEELKRRVEEYENKFGDLRNYDDRVTATHAQEMISATMSLNRGVKEFVKRFSYMTKYKDAINRMDYVTKREYNESLRALKDVADSFKFVQEENEDIIINQ